MNSKRNSQQAGFYGVAKFYAPKNNYQKEWMNDLVASFNSTYLEAPDGEKVVFFQVKKKDMDGKQYFKDNKGEIIGEMETLTAEELKEKYPAFQ